MWRLVASSPRTSSQERLVARHAGSARKAGAAPLAEGSSGILSPQPRRMDEREGSRRHVRPAAVKLLISLLLLLAVGALYGGGALVADPSGGLLDMPVSLLAGSPFGDYLVPGLILLVLLGIFPLVVAWGLWFRPAWARVGVSEVDAAWLAALFVGVSLIVWILVQMTILRFFLQPVLLAQGIAIIGTSLLPATRRHYGAAGRKARTDERGP